MNTTLIEIVRQIDDGRNIRATDIDTFCRLINATGPLNAHLQFTPDSGCYERTIPIEAQSEIFGDLLAVVYDAHWPQLLLHEYSDFDEMEAHILDGVLAGCEVFAFKDGQRLRYRIDYNDANGPRRLYEPNVPTPAVCWVGT